jgi:hypothetical protein
MLCPKCLGEMVEIVSEYICHSLLIGEMKIPELPIISCNTPECSQVFLSYSSCKVIEAYYQEEESIAIDSLPIGEFISGKDAANLLEISMKDFWKHFKIKRGFIISKRLGDKKYYYKPSVEAFAKTNDGRIRINF